MTNFYVVATPIGNLGDISQRALNVLREVDLVLAEDTRTTKNLLNHFGIEKPIVSYHQHSKISKINEILAMLRNGQNLALVSDAGTPGISDPGGQLIEAIVRELGDLVKIEPIPGPSAITAIASVCGFPMDRFLFLGFPPAKNKRKKFFEEVIASKYPVILYESCHRILKTLGELKEVCSFPERKERTSFQIVVGRELTKKFETIYRGTLNEVAKEIENDKVGGNIKGEFVVAIDKK
ncbi:16S rRNA (cytidine(1402)-2'-O)-methyltransferase [bacterium (Candidatus Gribaldobacteria) CG02_land_8_20_14_3_00_41_15]|uniref:Ribosomal RNA small subunit methyltransferase I n=1 Tax=bacterium (Candidatus Gribaldobacteria) CG02_land_8_20_14_3_00_41_15 TaxID=2014270 RepID=A0A2M7DDE5_9BACT|nr:MAG: 16S rRNA (cytidine(1402)-2'-O)-methyltransferase [bacterium (Candidatus Gribaldobacteria) CG02_land_8_20_14_3_00_41_15]